MSCETNCLLLLCMCAITAYSNDGQYLTEDCTELVEEWRPPSDAMLTILGEHNLEDCSIPRISYTEEDEFIEKYYNKKAVIITSAPSDVLNWPVHEAWKDKTSFFRAIKILPQEIFQAGDAYEITQHGGSAKFYDFKNYVRNSPSSFNSTTFDNDVYSFSVFRSTKVPEYEKFVPSSTFTHPAMVLINAQDHLEQLAVGNEGSGLGSHTHKEAWSTVIIGRKLWFICADECEYYDNCCKKLPEGVVSYKMVKNKDFKIYRDQGVIQSCIVGVGETIYVPDDMKHMTMNIGDVVSTGQRRAHTNIETLDYYMEIIRPEFIPYIFEKALKVNKHVFPYTFSFKHIRKTLICISKEKYLKAVCPSSEKYSMVLASIDKFHELLQYSIKIIQKAIIEESDIIQSNFLGGLDRELVKSLLDIAAVGNIMIIHSKKSQDYEIMKEKKKLTSSEKCASQIHASIGQEIVIQQITSLVKSTTPMFAFVVNYLLQLSIDVDGTLET